MCNSEWKQWKFNLFTNFFQVSAKKVPKTQRKNFAFEYLALQNTSNW